MDTICRCFAGRLERRRMLIVSSVRFHRVAEEVLIAACLFVLLPMPMACCSGDSWMLSPDLIFATAVLCRMSVTPLVLVIGVLSSYYHVHRLFCSDCISTDHSSSITYKSVVAPCYLYSDSKVTALLSEH